MSDHTHFEPHVSGSKCLITGDTRRQRHLTSVAADLEKQGFHSIIVPMVSDPAIGLPASLSTLLYGNVVYLMLTCGWSQSALSIVLKSVAEVMGIEIVYEVGADAELPPNEMNAQLEGYSSGVKAAWSMMEDVDDGD